MSTSDGYVLQATRRLLEATSHVTGAAFFENLAAALADSLGTRWGLVGQLVGGRVASRAVWDSGRRADGFSYDLEGTPCEGVLTNGTCHFERDVQRLFPRDALLVSMRAESYSGTPIRGADGAPIGLLVALNDRPTPANLDMSTILELFASRAANELEREAAELRLRSSEARYREIVTTCTEGVWVIDTEGRTTFVNEQMARMFGYAPDDMLGQSMYAFMDEDARREAETNLARRAAGIVERHEFRFRHKNGSEVWTTLATSPLRDGQGHFTGALAMVTDITERRALDRKLQQTQKLESLGILAGGIAHDFNNLLVGILGNIFVLRRASEPGSAAATALDDVETAALRAADLVGQLLAYAGKGQVAPEPVDINEVVRETQQLLQSALSKRATLRFDLIDSLPPVNADPTQLRQVVMNLLTNASDALDDRDGAITVSTRLIHADHAYLDSTYIDERIEEGEYVALAVSDTGSGIDAATMSHLFDPFFTTKASGRGLGLAAVLGIVRRHHGTVRVESAMGAGSTFTVLLPPCEGRASVSDAAGATTAVEGARGTILVVDDEAMVADTARRLLETVGYRVRIARDGREGVDVFEANPDIDLVLLDLCMPKMSGAEVFRALRASRPEVPVVLCSGYDRDDAASRVGEGLAGVLKKPWRAEQLFSTIEAALTNARA